jgi:hypothetical protein
MQSMPFGRSNRADRRMALALFLALWAAYGFVGPGWTLTSPNTVTRLGFVFSALNLHSPAIDAFANLTIDKAIFAGHVYMDKAPGLSLMALPVVAGAEVVARLAGMGICPIVDGHISAFYVISCFASVIFTTALFGAAAASVLYLLARRGGGSPSASLFASLGFALCTPAFGWATTFFSHDLAGSCLFIGFAAMVVASEKREPARGDARLAALSGLLLSWSVVVEFTSGAAVLVIACVGLWRLRLLRGAVQLRLLTAALVAGLIGLLPLAWYNHWAFGAVTHLGYSDVVGFDGMRQGFFGISLPRPDVVMALLVGTRRGLLWVAPLIALAPLAWAASFRRLPIEIACMLAVIPICYLLINSGYAYWDGGSSIGPRHITPALPFICLAMAPLWDGAKRRLRMLLGSVAAISFLVSLSCAITEMTPPLSSQFPLVDFVIPALERDHMHSLLMLVGFPGVAVLPVLALIGVFAVRSASVAPTRSSADAALHVTGHRGSLS